MLVVRRVLLKLMELGLGVTPCFTLKTRDPVFVSFRLAGDELEAVRRALPAGFTLRALRFAETDSEPAFWLSYNVYELRYPREEMRSIRKVRCEINTFVRDAAGRDGVFVFCGSPFVSREERRSVMGTVSDLAERFVMTLYGCGELTRVLYELDDVAMRIDLAAHGSRLSLELPVSPSDGGIRLSDDYHRFNDVSFFDEGRSCDLVTVSSAFVLARFHSLPEDALGALAVETPFFRRAPDAILLHRGEIEYRVSALNPVKSPPRERSRVTTQRALGLQLAVMGALVAGAAAFPEVMADMARRPELYLHAKLVHVLSVTLFFANVVIGTIWETRSLLSGKAELMRFTYQTVRWLDAFFTAPMILLAVVSGLVLGTVIGGLFSIGWLSLAFALFVLSGLLWVSLDVPVQYRLEKLFAELPAGGTTLPGPLARLLRLRLGLNLVAILPLLVVFALMVLKPALPSLTPWLAAPRGAAATGIDPPPPD